MSIVIIGQGTGNAKRILATCSISAEKPATIAVIAYDYFDEFISFYLSHSNGMVQLMNIIFFNLKRQADPVF